MRRRLVTSCDHTARGGSLLKECLRLKLTFLRFFSTFGKRRRNTGLENRLLPEDSEQTGPFNPLSLPGWPLTSAFFPCFFSAGFPILEIPSRARAFSNLSRVAANESFLGSLTRIGH